jgi:PRTRC genetic system ThiF family protein
MKHRIHPEMITRQAKILLVGAGGTGSRILGHLVDLHLSLKAKGHPSGLHVTVIDADRVSPSNIGRQAFYPADVGRSKALTLVNRANMALNGDTVWRGLEAMLVPESDVSGFDLVIGAVDSRRGRLAILRSLENCSSGCRYWLDFGNRIDDGQVILGEVTSRKRKTDADDRLPHAGELYPELIDPTYEPKEDIPSCSLAEALEKQALFVNPTLAVQGMALLGQLFTTDGIEVQGVFVNLKRMTVLPMKIDPQMWDRFGVVRNGKRQKVVRPSVKKRVEKKAAVAA